MFFFFMDIEWALRKAYPGVGGVCVRGGGGRGGGGGGGGKSGSTGTSRSI